MLHTDSFFLQDHICIYLLLCVYIYFYIYIYIYVLYMYAPSTLGDPQDLIDRWRPHTSPQQDFEPSMDHHDSSVSDAERKAPRPGNLAVKKRRMLVDDMVDGRNPEKTPVDNGEYI